MRRKSLYLARHKKPKMTNPAAPILITPTNANFNVRLCTGQSPVLSGINGKIRVMNLKGDDFYFQFHAIFVHKLNYTIMQKIKILSTTAAMLFFLLF